MVGYNEYQPMNLPWLNAIPSHWEVRRNKNIFSETTEEVGQKFSEYTLLSLTLNGIIPRDMSGGGKFPASFDKYKIVKKGDMAFCLFDIDETPRTVGLSQHDGMLTGAYTIMKVHNINPQYVYYYYLALDNQKALKPLYTGLRKTVNINTFQSTKVPVPPCLEQDQIVRFLDWKVSTINRLINIKKRRIHEYEDWKACEIHRIVTSGFTGDVPKTETGIAWIPEIPEHWDMRRIKFLFDMRDERNYRPLSDVNLISLYTRLGVVQNKDVEYTTGNRARNADGYKIVHKNDIIVNIILCWMGAIGMSNYDGVTSPAYDIYIPKEGVYSRYYHYLFRTKAFSGECYKAGKGIMAMRWRTYSPQFRNISVPLPPLEEQIEIAAYLDERCATIDRQIEITQQQIQQLRELKDRLIADAVTGKIDVRNIQIPDYEYVDEEPDAVDSGEETEEQEDE